MNPPIDLTYVCNFVGTLEAGAINYLEGGARLGWEEHFLEGELGCMVQRDAVVADRYYGRYCGCYCGCYCGR